MKFISTIILMIVLSFSSFAQVEVRAGMGINFLSNPSLTEYIQTVVGQQLSSFNSAVNFSAEGGYYLNNNFQMGLEVAYLINSYSYPNISGSYDFSYSIVMPSITSYYVIQGQGYNFKFGGGAGVRISNVKETLPTSTTQYSYSAFGLGFLLRIDGNTALSDKVYANIGGDIRYDWNGKPKLIANENVNLNSLSLGVRLGITYRF